MSEFFREEEDVVCTQAPNVLESMPLTNEVSAPTSTALVVTTSMNTEPVVRSMAQTVAAPLNPTVPTHQSTRRHEPSVTLKDYIVYPIQKQDFDQHFSAFRNAYVAAIATAKEPTLVKQAMADKSWCTRNGFRG